MIDKSPIQQAIDNYSVLVNSLDAGNPNKVVYAHVINYLQSLTPTEKEFAGKVWDAGEQWGYCIGSQTVPDVEPLDKQQLLDKYYKP